MTRTIQDLKDENQLLRDGIRTITAGLNNCEHADLLSVDPDLAALDLAFGHMASEHNHAVRQREMATQAMEAWVERGEKETQRANELAAIITCAQALADKDRVEGPVYGEAPESSAGPGWKSAMGRDLHAVLKKGMQALVDHYDGVHQRAWDNGYLNGREDTLSEQAQQERALRDLVSRQNVAMCCAMMAEFGDPTPVVEILNNAAMTTPEDFEGCNEDDVERIHRLDLSYRGITVKAVERGEA